MLDAEGKPPRRKTGLVMKILGLTALLAVVPTIATIYVVNTLVDESVRADGVLRGALGGFVADDGEALAAELGERVAIGIADDVEPSYDEPADAAAIVQRRAIVSPRLPEVAAGVSISVVPLAWHGSSGDQEGALIDLAVSVDVAQIDSVMGDAGRDAGSSRTCWRYAVRAPDPDDIADYDEVDCPGDLSPAQPSPTPLPSLGVEESDEVRQVLDELPDGAGPEDAEAALRAVFPGVDVVRAERAADELVAAVGVTQARDCIVAVRPDGGHTWRFTAFDKVLVEPGELGCTPSLYTVPVSTH
ncbi:hypothetical protein AAG589_16560 [Isoptericola sp. F-RaC21]|uniref:hypothetical protein n=1 Tax=Isoptericola sp. F-RaC21 TaxID=3141452 RepID=UPI00315B4E9B